MKRLLIRIAPFLALASTVLGQRSQPHGGMQESSGAPEIDTALAGTAVALVVGGVLVLTSVRRKKLARN